MPNSASTDIFYRYKTQNRLKDIETARECFNLFDNNKEGYLDLAKFKIFLSTLFSYNNKPYTIPEDKIIKIFDLFNIKKDTKLSLQEFEKLWIKLVIPTLCPKTALIIVDVQNDFISGTMSISNCPAKQDGFEVVPCINNMIKTIHFDAIAYTYDWHPEDHCSFIENVDKRKIASGSPIKENIKVNDIVIFEDYPDIEQKLWPAHCIQGSHGSELHPSLIDIDEKTDEMKRKKINAYKGVKSDIDSYSAFFDNCKLNETSLNTDLKRHGINELYICGLAADVCVAATCNDALDLNYRVIYVEDACRGIVEEDIVNQKEKLAMRNAVIGNSKQVLNMISGRDRRPEHAFVTLKI
ncbi:unnamed protein product [Brachionus calyciflorus]|uniref:nicotinamidase n=1 Tax=Brachionus calyciflorus TaxID=104777 RepID=A0A813SAY4_9BILA|nr:unnamed protein product [Brachionus calyciflorus]